MTLIIQEAEQIRSILRLLYMQGDDAIPGRCWEAEDAELIEEWSSWIRFIDPKTLGTLKEEEARVGIAGKTNQQGETK